MFWQVDNKKYCPRTSQYFIYITIILVSIFLVDLLCMLGYLITNCSFIADDRQNRIYDFTILAIILLLFY